MSKSSDDDGAPNYLLEASFGLLKLAKFDVVDRLIPPNEWMALAWVCLVSAF